MAASIKTSTEPEIEAAVETVPIAIAPTPTSASSQRPALREVERLYSELVSHAVRAALTSVDRRLRRYGGQR
jgi:hypothetical protein